MKKTTLLAVLIVLLSALVTVIDVHIVQDKVDTVELQNLTDREQNERIKALEKEVRILKTDIYIMQYGYEGEKNE